MGDPAEAPVFVVPDPLTLFLRRAERFRMLAADHPLAPYLSFLGDLSRVQHDIRTGLPTPAIPDADAVRQSVEHGMPAINRAYAAADGALGDAVHRLIDAAGTIAMPDQATAALGRLHQADTVPAIAGRSAGPLTLGSCIDAVLTDAIPAEAVAEHIFVGAALQVHFARVAAALHAAPLRSLGDFICPVCGGAPATSSIVGWAGIDKLRYATCTLCATRWNAVRVKCLACSSTKGIHYQAIEGVAETIKAECCDECRCFVKILAEDESPALDPIADDVASLGLDMMVREAGYRRAGMNLFLLGF